MARAERMLRDDADRARDRDVQRAHPRARRALGARSSSSCSPTTQLREWLPKLVGIQRARRVALPDGAEVRRGRPGRGTAHPRGHDAGGALPNSRSRREQVDAFAQGPVADRRRPSRVPRGGRARRDAQRAELLAISRRRAADGADPGPAPRSRAAAAGRAARRRRRLRPPRPRRRGARARRRTRARARPASRSRSRRATPASCSRARASRSGTASRA